MQDRIQVSSCKVSRFFPLTVEGLEEAVCFYKNNKHHPTITIDIRKYNKFPSYGWEEHKHEHIIEIE